MSESGINPPICLPLGALPDRLDIRREGSDVPGVQVQLQLEEDGEVVFNDIPK